MNTTQSKKILIPKEMLNSSTDTIIDSDFIEVCYSSSGYSWVNIMITYVGLELQVTLEYSANTQESYDAFNAIVAHIHREANSLNNQIQ